MHHKFRNFAIIANAVLLLSASVVFAQGRPASAGSGINSGIENSYHPSSSVYASSSATSTQSPPQGSARIPAQGQAGATGYRPATTGSTTPGGMRATGQSYAADGQARGAEMRQMAQNRIAAIQDKVKQQLAQNLSGIFDRLNQVWTQHFSQLLDRYAAILQKIQDRANAAAASGKDVTATNTAIQAAQAVIASARAAVAVQAAKTYILELSATSTAVTAATSTPQGQAQIIQGLQDSFQALRKQLFADLFALRDGPMTDTRTAVQSALQTLGKIPGVDQVNVTSTATSTGATSTNQ